MSEAYTLDRPTALTCPDCGGAMATETAGSLLRFRCHIGHVLTAETMLSAQFNILEIKLAAVLVALKERAELCRQMRDAAQAGGEDAAALDAARQEALDRAEIIKGLLESAWT